jgi:hypothetical protein
LSKRRKNRPEKGPSKNIQPGAPPDKIEPWLEKNGKWVLLGGWAFLLMLYLSLASDELGGILGGDNAQYLMLARSLAKMKSYRDWYLAGAPAHTKYPFLFPLLLSAFAFSSRQVFYSHLMIQFFASMIPLLLCGWARMQGETRLKSLLIFFLAGSIPAWYSFLLNLLTEPVFMFFMMLSIFILAYSQKRGFDIYLAIIFALAVWASAMIREVGLVLFGALSIGIVLDPRLRRTRVSGIPLIVVLAGVFIIGYAAWSIRNMTAGEGGLYFKQFLEKNPYLPQEGMMGFGDVIARIKTNFYLHIPHVGGFAFPYWIFKSQTADIWVSLIFLLVIVIGLVSRLRARHFAAELVFICLFGVAMVWYFQEERFSLPVLPLAVFYFAKGIDAIANLFKIRSQKLTVAIAGGLILWQTGFMFWLCAKYHDKQIYPQGTVQVDRYGEWSQPVLDASKYITWWKFGPDFWAGTADMIVMQKVAREILPENAVVACRKPTLFWYFADRKADWYLYGVPPEEEWKEFRKKQISYVFMSSSNRELVDMVQANKDSFELLAAIRRSGFALAKVRYPE